MMPVQPPLLLSSVTGCSAVSRRDTQWCVSRLPNMKFLHLEVALRAPPQPNMITPTTQHPSQIRAYLHRLAYEGDFKQEPWCQSIIQ